MKVAVARGDALGLEATDELIEATCDTLTKLVADLAGLLLTVVV